MSHNVPETDWKHFRKVQKAALERFCQRTLQELEPLIRNSALTYHQRYLDVFKLLKHRDRELGRAFNDPRRSHMIEQLAVMCVYDLVEPGEFEGFTAQTRAAVEGLVRF